MTERRGGPRSQQHEIAIDAPVEAVWKAITDAEELTRWFVVSAKVEPGVGGSFRISWDDSLPEKGNRIEVWEPNRKLRVALDLEMGAARLAAPIVEEYTIEQRGGKTVLRLVESGVPDSPEWDGFYDGTNAGWEQFFRTLRHYLEHHAGKPRTTITITGALPGSLDDAWANLTGASGLAVDPIAGKPFAVRLAANETLSGQIVAAKAPGSLELTIREFGDAYLAHSMAGAGGSQYVYSILSLFGADAAAVEAIRIKWQEWLTNVLHLKAPPDETPASC